MAEQTITVRQTGSPIRRDDRQRKTLIGLGLNKVGRERTLEKTSAIVGMVNKVAHMVQVRTDGDWMTAERFVAEWRAEQRQKA